VQASILKPWFIVVHIRIFCKKEVTLAEVFSGGNPRRILFSPGNGFADKMEHIPFCRLLLVTRKDLQSMDMSVQRSTVR